MATAGNSINSSSGNVGHRSDDLALRQTLRTAFFQHLTAYVLVNAGLATLNLTRNPDHLWFLWVVGGWGIGIVAHAVKVFCFPGTCRTRVR